MGTSRLPPQRFVVFDDGRPTFGLRCRPQHRIVACAADRPGPNADRLCARPQTAPSASAFRSGGLSDRRRRPDHRYSSKRFAAPHDRIPRLLASTATGFNIVSAEGVATRARYSTVARRRGRTISATLPPPLLTTSFEVR